MKVKILVITLFLTLLTTFRPVLPHATISNLSAVTQEEQIIISTVEQVRPSVVTIRITLNERNSPASLFERIKVILGLTPRQAQTARNIGSGIVVDENGTILTNYHVVENKQAQYSIITLDNREFPVRSAIYNEPEELAILATEADNLIPARLGNSRNLRVGQKTIAIGTALGTLPNTVTTGVISGLGRNIDIGGSRTREDNSLENLIQTSSAINFGNSGGALFNTDGEVIGINTAVAVNTENIGFAIPINRTRSFLSDIQ